MGDMYLSCAAQSEQCVTASECARSVDRLTEDADTDDDETCKGLLGAAAQCIYLLYGLDLTERDEQWTDGFQVGIFRLMYTWD